MYILQLLYLFILVGCRFWFFSASVSITILKWRHPLLYNSRFWCPLLIGLLSEVPSFLNLSPRSSASWFKDQELTLVVVLNHLHLKSLAPVIYIDMLIMLLIFLMSLSNNSPSVRWKWASKFLFSVFTDQNFEYCLCLQVDEVWFCTCLGFVLVSGFYTITICFSACYYGMNGCLAVSWVCIFFQKRYFVCFLALIILRMRNPL